jgi:hypothetical protein
MQANNQSVNKFNKFNKFKLCFVFALLLLMKDRGRTREERVLSLLLQQSAMIDPGFEIIIVGMLREIYVDGRKSRRGMHRAEPIRFCFLVRGGHAAQG